MDGHSFNDVLGGVLSNDLAKEAARIEADRRAREALRKQHDALQSVSTMTGSELLDGVMREGDNVATGLRVPAAAKETTDAGPKQLPPRSAFPLPGSRR